MILLFLCALIKIKVMYLNIAIVYEIILVFYLVILL